MRKLGLTLAAALVFSVSVFADGVKDNNASADWDGSINKAKLTKYLKLDGAQDEKVADICDYFKAQMKLANTSNSDKSAEIRNAVYGNLKLMKETLNEEQYSNYVRLMAMTLQNKGINIDVNNK